MAEEEEDGAYGMGTGLLKADFVRSVCFSSLNNPGILSFLVLMVYILLSGILLSCQHSRQPHPPSLLHMQSQNRGNGGRANKRRHTVHFADVGGGSSSSSLAFLLGGLDLEKAALSDDDDEDNAKRSNGRPPVMGDAVSAMDDDDGDCEEMETTSATSSIRDLNELLQSDRTTTKTFDDSIFDFSTNAAFMASGIGDASWTSTSSSTLAEDHNNDHPQLQQHDDELGRSQSHQLNFEGDNDGEDDASLSLHGT
jgi:hypothetical protein